MDLCPDQPDGATQDHMIQGHEGVGGMKARSRRYQPQVAVKGGQQPRRGTLVQVAGQDDRQADTTRR